MVWSEQLAEFARRNGPILWLGGGSSFIGVISPYGENLFEITGAVSTSAEVVDQWASESKDYQYGSNSCRGVCGHYTQMVWRGTKRLGCAAARRGKTEVWVCNYDPPGNWIGNRPY